MLKKINQTVIGSGRPKIAIIGCVHGDEIIGKKVIKEIKKMKIIRGTLGLFIANEPALLKKKRELKTDLNRSFPGKKGARFESGLAYRLHREVIKYDLVIDIHATNSRFDKLAIVTRLDEPIKKLLALVPIKKVMLARQSVFGGKEMITHAKTGLAIEYGPNKSGKNYRHALADMSTLLANLGMISGARKKFTTKELYDASGTYKVPEDFRQNNDLQDFHKIKKGQIIGKAKRRAIHSRKDFYPLFLGKGAYKGTLAIAAKKRIIKLK